MTFEEIISFLQIRILYYYSHCSILSENRIRDVNSKLFHGLVKLESLSLYSNKISCVTPGAFDALVSLKSLNLIANPFNCNCHMAWFADWLRVKGFTSGGPRCAHPQHLKDRPIYALANHDFRCTGTLKNFPSLKMGNLTILRFHCESKNINISLFILSRWK